VSNRLRSFSSPASDEAWASRRSKAESGLRRRMGFIVPNGLDAKERMLTEPTEFATSTGTWTTAPPSPPRTTSSRLCTWPA